MNNMDAQRIIRCIFFLVTLVGIQQICIAQINPKWKSTSMGEISLVTNPGGATLGYSLKSGVRLLTVNGFAFKDLNKNGQLDKY